MRPIPLASPDDPRIDAYRVIKERDLVGRGGRFVVEGRTVLDVALSPRNRFRLESLLLSESRVAALGKLLAQAPDDVPIYTASQTILDGITGFHIHRGLLGIGLALILGIGMRIAAVSGTLLLLLMYLAELPLVTNPIIDDHITMSLTIIALTLLGAGSVLGLGKAWKRIPFVQRNTWLV